MEIVNKLAARVGSSSKNFQETSHQHTLFATELLKNIQSNGPTWPKVTLCTIFSIPFFRFEKVFTTCQEYLQGLGTKQRYFCNHCHHLVQPYGVTSCQSLSFDSTLILHHRHHTMPPPTRKHLWPTTTQSSSHMYNNNATQGWRKAVKFSGFNCSVRFYWISST